MSPGWGLGKKNSFAPLTVPKPSLRERWEPEMRGEEVRGGLLSAFLPRDVSAENENPHAAPLQQLPQGRQRGVRREGCKEARRFFVATTW